MRARWWSTLLLTATMVAAVAPRATADTIYGFSGASSTFRNGGWVFGQVFTVGAQDLNLTALGAYDAGGDGFVSAGGIPVGLYDYATGNLLASTHVDNTAPLQGQFRFATVAPLLLVSGHQYEVVSVNGLDSYNNVSGISVSPLVIDDGFRYSLGSSLSFQGAGAKFTGSGTLWMPNLQATPVESAPVPLPSAALAGLVLLGVLACAPAAAARRRATSR